MEMDLEEKQEIESSFASHQTALSNIDDILQNKLEDAIQKHTSKVLLHHIAKIASEHSAVDLAYAVYNLPPDARPVLYDNLPSRDAKVTFLINTDSVTRINIFRSVNEEELKRIFEKMPPDEAVAVLEDMSEKRYRSLMSLIDVKKAQRIQELKQHRRNSAGRLMTNEFFAFQMDISINEASRVIRNNPRIDFTKGVYICNEIGELQGYVPSRNMVINVPTISLRQVMRPCLHKVHVDTTREEVIEIFERYRIPFLPVVDMSDRLVGVISQEDVVEAMEDLADAMIARIGGTGEKVALNDGVIKKFFARSPWLLATLFAGLINVGVISSFKNRMELLLPVFMLFIPLITGLSGNIGIQCSTVLVRGFATGTLLSCFSKRSLFLKELAAGFFTGAVFGLFCGLFVALSVWLLGVGSPLMMGLIISLGLIGACLVGTFLGVFSPFFFIKIGIDPAVSSGPMVTAFNDCLSMVIYFLIAWGLSTLLFV